ncbi:hypothetical protein NEOKW01_0620 [Nematocida sp. AWRm80]|nr:hypothetical protein NEOKW01_0620 [Nematocida sp. AWRm80]
MSEADLQSKYNNRITNIIRILGNIFGYTIVIEGNKVKLTSIYAFDEEDTIVLSINNNTINVEENEYTKRLEKEKKLYLEKGNSLSAFLSAVTLSLFEQSTFQ